MLQVSSRRTSNPVCTLLSGSGTFGLHGQVLGVKTLDRVGTRYITDDFMYDIGGKLVTACKAGHGSNLSIPWVVGRVGQAGKRRSSKDLVLRKQNIRCKSKAKRAG